MRSTRPIALMTRCVVLGGVLAAPCLTLLAPVSGEETGVSGTTTSRFREPVALAFSSDETRLFVANRRSGSLSVVDPGSGRVVAEHEVGRGLSDLAVLPERGRVLAVDQPASELLLLDVSDERANVVDRLKLGNDLVSIAVAPDGASCVTASTRSRQLSFVALAPTAGVPSGTLKLSGTLALPFSPRTITLARNGSVIVAADAFGGRLALVDAASRSVVRLRSFPMHNIRGMAISPDGASVVIAHQVLLPGARTSYEDIHWGQCINNDLRIFSLEALLGSDSDAHVLKESGHHKLGDPGNGSGDPAAVAFDHDGHFIVTLAGIDEVLVGTDPGILSFRPPVGRRPVAVAVDREGRSAVVANALDDSVSVVDLRSGRRTQTIFLGPCPEADAAERGRRLFSFAGLSHSGWMSCQSCHTDGHSNGQNSDTLGDGDFGAPKRVPSLFGVAHTGPWGWDGRFTRLEDQVRQSVESTMQGQDPPADLVADLVAYLRTLEPLAPEAHPSAAVDRGRAQFTRECASCHAGLHYTSKGKYDVGLVDEAGNRRFNPPSLQGIAQRTPLFHDGRAQTLDDVLRTHPPRAKLTREQVADVIAFLKSL